MPTILDTTPFWSGRLAKKVKGLKAKPVSSLVTDRSVLHKLLLDTLEAKEPLDATTCFCIGESDDAWQQSSADLIKGYDLVSIDADGWLHFSPKPTKVVEFFEVTSQHLPGAPALLAATTFYIFGKWGQTIDGVSNLQQVRPGDFVARQLHDPSDRWVVRRDIWLRTYDEVLP